MRLGLLVVGVCCLVSRPAAGDEQFTITPRASASTQISVPGFNPVKISQALRSEQTSEGNERDMGYRVASASRGEARASIGAVNTTLGGASVTADLAANARGGFFRKCLTEAVPCTEFATENTPAAASAEAEPFFDIKFRPGARPIPYELAIAFEGEKQNATVEFDITDPKGVARSYKSDRERVLIQGDSNLQYTVKARLAAEGGEQGAAGAWAGKLKGVFSVKMKRSAIIWARSLDRAIAPMLAPTGRIAGGRNLLPGEFPSVGALLLDKRPHCTGTLLGATRVITAAHCIHGYDLKQMTFGLGENAWAIKDPVPVVSGRYPKNELGFDFNDKSLVDDIAIVHLQKPMIVKFSELHGGTPALEALLKDSTPVSFVGYGYELIDGSPGGLGIKRMVTMTLAEVRPKTIHYGEPGRNTCNGDSGGPALFTDSSKKWLLAGITSAGDLGCTRYGINSRVDAYLKWIAKY
jgi:hypothetical protein